jgi:hypothetical protein
MVTLHESGQLPEPVIASAVHVTVRGQFKFSMLMKLFQSKGFTQAVAWSGRNKFYWRNFLGTFCVIQHLISDE